MKLKIHSIFTPLASALLLVCGCTDRQALDTDGNEIRFGAAPVLFTEGTKADGPGIPLDTRTQFADGSTLLVSGWHKRTGEKIFDGQEVTFQETEGNWDYSPKQKWSWGNDDWYDFLAVPKDQNTDFAATITAPDNNNPFRLSIHYDATVKQKDLLMAGIRRRVTEDDPSRIVNLNFQHLLSAVKVVFYKEAGGQKFVVTSFHFTDLLTQGDIVGYWDETNKKFTSRLSNTTRLATPQLGETRIDAEKNPDNYLSVAGIPYDPYAPSDPSRYELLLPQDLDPLDAAPSLVVTFKDDVDQDPDDSVFNPYEYNPEPIPLKDICIKDTDTPITQWEPGYVYIYEVHILLNGGVLVNVVTTKWEDVLAETPGLML